MRIFAVDLSTLNSIDWLRDSNYLNKNMEKWIRFWHPAFLLPLIYASFVVAVASQQSPIPEAKAAYEAAREFERNGEVSKAIAEYDRAMTLSPTYLEPVAALGELYWKKNRLPDAELLLTQALSLKPDDLPSMKILGLVLNRQGKYEASLKLYQRLLQTQPQLTAERVHYAEALIAGRQMDAAAEQLRQALADQSLEKPLRVEAHLRLGLLLNREERFKTALTQFEKALELDPDSPLSNVYYGVSLYNLKRTPEAEASLKKALKLGGADAATANLYLGQIYFDQKNYPLAIEAWENYLKAKPDSGNTAQIRAAIEQMKKAVGK